MPTDTATRSTPLGRRIRRLTSGERRDEAGAFIRRFHRENRLSISACRKRVAEVDRSLKRRGTYEHTPAELAFGARLAWRHHARCIGRLFWESLEVIDCRNVIDPDEIASRTMEHMKTALGNGGIRSMITVFAPVSGDQLPAYIESAQVTQYAGYIEQDGRCLGDAQNIEATRTAMSLGWEPPPEKGRFDFLPLVLRDVSGRRILYDTQRSVVREIDISHPAHPELDSLALRWYAVPCVTGMIMTIGGIDYPCAPFNGFYMGTEIASRNLADENRYDLLPQVANVLGDNPRQAGPQLWKDRALLVLNEAVLHSFERAGVTMVDHHTASRQYMEFVRRERAEGREPSGNWSWIVPPQASASCPVFHIPMRDLAALPNFYHSRAADGARLKPNFEEEAQGWLQSRLAAAKRRVRQWQRARI